MSSRQPSRSQQAISGYFKKRSNPDDVEAQEQRASEAEAERQRKREEEEEKVRKIRARVPGSVKTVADYFKGQ